MKFLPWMKTVDENSLNIHKILKKVNINTE